MQRHDDLLRDSESIDGQEFSQQPPLSSWCQRQIEVQQCWQQARPQNIVNLFSAENIVQMTCKHCHVREAIIHCGECLLSEWFCAECDQLVHKHHTLQSRQTNMNGFYKYIPPTEFVKLRDNKYIICEQGWCLSFFKLLTFIYFALTNIIIQLLFHFQVLAHNPNIL